MIEHKVRIVNKNGIALRTQTFTTDERTHFLFKIRKCNMDIFRIEMKASEANPCLALNLIILSIMGIPKARVFPVPVLARPIMSRPCIAGTSTALCAGEKAKKAPQGFNNQF